MAAGSSHIAGFFFSSWVALRRRCRSCKVFRQLVTSFFSFFSQRFFCWKPGWRNWSDFSLNHHIFLGTVVWCCYPWDASPWFHKVCCPEKCAFSGFGYSMVFIFPQQMGSEGYSQRYVPGWDVPKCLKIRVVWWVTFIRHYGSGFMMLCA